MPPSVAWHRGAGQARRTASGALCATHAATQRARAHAHKWRHACTPARSQPHALDPLVHSSWHVTYVCRIMTPAAGLRPVARPGARDWFAERRQRWCRVRGRCTEGRVDIIRALCRPFRCLLSLMYVTALSHSLTAPCGRRSMAQERRSPGWAALRAPPWRRGLGSCVLCPAGRDCSGGCWSHHAS